MNESPELVVDVSSRKISKALSTKDHQYPLSSNFVLRMLPCIV